MRPAALPGSRISETCETTDGSAELKFRIQFPPAASLRTFGPSRVGAMHRRFISMGAAGWHICLDVLARLLAGKPIGRMVGADAMKFGGWQRLNAEYAKQFGVEVPTPPGRNH